MIYILCGPSGSGKTTFLKILSNKFQELNIINLFTFRDKLRNESELGRIEKQKEEYVNYKNTFSNIFKYENDIYGLNIPIKENLKKYHYIIDYPGEYPECKEFLNIDWKGILILPQNEIQLKERLTKCNRFHRIESSVAEFFECREELTKSVYKFPKWSIIINNELKDIHNYINGIKTVANIVYKK